MKGDFNSWDGREHPMRQLGQSGVWELFVPGVGSGTTYKYVDPRRRRPVAREGRPDGVRTPRSPPATVVGGLRVDATSGATTRGWPRAPRSSRIAEPMSVYEVHLGSWKRHPGGRLCPTASSPTTWSAYLTDLGFTHVELMPVMQHPFGGSWGYHVTSYFAPDSRFGDPDGFRCLVDRLHQAGIGVILDWVPGHFATDEWALARFDGTPLYEDPNPQRGWHKEWGSHIFNFGRHEVRNFLYANARLLARGVPRRRAARRRRRLDALPRLRPRGGRVDAEQVRRPREPRGGAVPAGDERHRLQAGARRRHDRRGVDLLAAGHRRRPSGGGLGFGFKWNMGWMHDSLGYLEPRSRSTARTTTAR